MSLSIKFPLQIGTEKDFKDFQTESERMRFQIKNVIFTNPGERISLPEFGVGIKRYLFEPNLQSTTGRLRTAIISQINQYIEDVNLTEVVVQQIGEASIFVSVKCKLTGDSRIISFENIVTTSSTMGASY